MDDADRKVLTEVDNLVVRLRGVFIAILASGRPVTDDLYQRLIEHFESAAAALDGRLSERTVQNPPSIVEGPEPPAAPVRQLVPTTSMTDGRPDAPVWFSDESWPATAHRFAAWLADADRHVELVNIAVSRPDGQPRLTVFHTTEDRT